MKQSKEWLDKLALRMAEGWQTLIKVQPYQGDAKLILAHDFALCARDLKEHIDALEAELAAARTEFRQALATRDHEIAMLYYNQNAARDREKAAIAAALENLEKSVTCVFHDTPDSSCAVCYRDKVWRERIRLLITPDQSAGKEKL